MGFVAAVLNVAITIGVPIGILVYTAVWKRRRLKPYLVGMLTFAVFQIATRIPLLQLLLAKQMWFIVFSRQWPVAYMLFMGFTAGLFEEVGRYLFIRLFLKKQQEWKDAVFFGLGHGGIEAMMIGMQSVSLLIAGQALLSTASFGTVAAAGIERIFAVMLHIGFSVLVFGAVRFRKPWYLALAIFLHTMVDFLAQLLPLSLGFNVLQTELFLFAFSLCMMLLAIVLRKKWKEEGIIYEKET